MRAFELVALTVPSHLGYVALAGLVALESMGVPVPGETALIAAGILAQQGHLKIEVVIAVAAGAAIAGDNLGYLLGRKGGRSLLRRAGPLERQRRAVLARGERFFGRYGAAAVFLGRWVTGVRVVVAWLAGADGMHWPKFLVWNALGGIAWAVTVGLTAFLLGAVGAKLIASAGVAAAVAVGLAGAVLFAGARLRRRRRASASATE
ncbi:MAG: DedA family protein [Actinomycetota bacterium]|nr:DedA family protein [Actinomycetota bacterium]